MRARKYLLIVAVALLGILVSDCVERRWPTEVRSHPEQWSQSGAADFHGTRVLARGAQMCAECHGADYRGSAEVPGCDDCHAGAGGHPYGYGLATGGVRFHGDDVAATGPGPCSRCHGADYRGGWSGVSCRACHPGGPDGAGALGGHPDGWLDPRSASFHGLPVYQDDIDDCTRCHGHALDGGTSGVSCGQPQCHG